MKMNDPKAKRHQHLIDLYHLRVSQMTPYTKEDFKRLTQSFEQWSEAETASQNLRKVPVKEQQRISGYLKSLRKENQRFNNARKHWQEVQAVWEKLKEKDIEAELPTDPTVAFSPPRVKSNFTAKLEADMKHIYAEMPERNRGDSNPPKRSAEGSNYSKQMKAMKAQQESHAKPDIELVEVSQ